jgi:hypothetical protein
MAGIPRQRRGASRRDALDHHAARASLAVEVSLAESTNVVQQGLSKAFAEISGENTRYGKSNCAKRSIGWRQAERLEKYRWRGDSI